MIFAEFSGGPRFHRECRSRGRSLVNGDFQFIYRAVAAEGDSADHHRQLRHQLAFAVGRDDEGAHRHSADRNCFHCADLHVLRSGVAARRVWNAIAGLHPEIVVGLIQNADPTETFHPIRGEIAGNDQAHRESVQHGQRLVIHRVGDNRVIEHGIFKVERF